MSGGIEVDTKKVKCNGLLRWHFFAHLYLIASVNMKCISQTKEGVIIKLRIIPRASKNEICGELGDALKIKLQAPPVEGKANKALIEFLADTLDISRNQISILSGDTGRNKRVLIAGVAIKDIEVSLT
ncbi:MAG: DUF167 domain-containing protein [Kiritimatiellae bacterium]|nr:DUF167 domain-containing protein [Kiritimatiellia bacterium]MDD5520437.1 DUF167 domain-containing protein [Kiritimatiellia bacterium]